MKRNDQTKKGKKPFFHNLFYNNRYLAIFSLLAAFIVWIVVVMEFSPETTYKIQDVPVVIDIENTTAEKLDLQPFTEKEYTVDVTVEGKRYSVTQKDISPEDIKVTANLNYVDSVGAHSLQLIATKNDPYADYEIVALSSEQVEVYFDAYKEIQVDLKTEEIPQNIIPDGYYVDGPVLSTTTVTVAGASTQINRIDKNNIYAKVSDEEKEDTKKLEKTAYFNAVIDIVDNYGNKVNYVSLKEETPVVITVPVLKKAEFATAVEFSNTPENYRDFIESIKITPETLNIGAQEDVVSAMENVSVGTIDFSDVKAGKNVFKFSKDDFSTNLKVFDEIEEVTVVVNIFEASKKVVDIDKSRVSFTNVPENCIVSLVDSYSLIESVTVFGGKDAISSLDADSVYAVVDMADYKGKTGRDTVLAKVTVQNANCWAYGSYEIPINVVVS